ncbi:Piso0_000912 [Millerozyma farinosa CBS 7064]|uniref:Piso0_000912 protein n=1 Tax=Pichia sorbitophila (strain ATCC MYA-4447 / BCRC 22081 / CBS 7064 / NBRC 10061 / NRRL Y-12695) TaxID=559304 RepID=G8YQE3_PICSO|nr:Piso0_000912 [Millerozyma farinosa CBS 7064]
MKLHFIVLLAISWLSTALVVKDSGSQTTDLSLDTAYDMQHISEIELEKRGLKHIAEKARRTKKLVTVLKSVLTSITEIKALKESKSVENLGKRDLVDDLLERVFVALKDSGLVNSIIKMSLTDDDVRPAITQLTIDLIEADVIPYKEIFEALKSSGLAVDVVKKSVTDPETREGLVEFTKELIKGLVAEDISLGELLPDNLKLSNSSNSRIML